MMAPAAAASCAAAPTSAPRIAAWRRPPVRAASCCPAPSAQRAALRRVPLACSRTTRTLDIDRALLEDLRLVVKPAPQLLDVGHPCAAAATRAPAPRPWGRGPRRATPPGSAG